MDLTSLTERKGHVAWINWSYEGGIFIHILYYATLQPKLWQPNDDVLSTYPKMCDVVAHLWMNNHVTDQDMRHSTHMCM